MRSRNATSSVWGRFLGFWPMCVFLSALKTFPRSSHTSCAACTNPQILNRGQESTGTDPQRFDGSQGTSADQADTHFFTSPTLCIFSSADRSQGDREHSRWPAQLDCRFWRQFYRKGAFHVCGHMLYLGFTDPYLLPSMGDSRPQFYDMCSQIPAIMYYISTFGSLVSRIWPVST